MEKDLNCATKIQGEEGFPEEVGDVSQGHRRAVLGNCQESALSTG